jgi:hypothetical protein
LTTIIGFCTMDWAKLLKALVRAAEAQGWRVERRTKH